MLNKFWIISLCFLLAGCPMDRIPFCSTGIRSLEILNLEKDPLYYKIYSADGEKKRIVHYNRPFHLAYDIYQYPCHEKSFELHSSEIKHKIDSIYTFYSDDSLKHSIYTISANDLKQLTASSSKLFANNAYQAVFTNNKIQYMHIREREKIQPLNWNKKDSDYLEYENLRLYITAQDYSPYTNIKDFEITLNFYLINWLFFVNNSDFPYYFNTSQIYIISNGKRIYLVPNNTDMVQQKIFPAFSTFWQHAKFTYHLSHTPIDNNIVYISGVSVNGRILDTYEYKLTF